MGIEERKGASCVFLNSDLLETTTLRLSHRDFGGNVAVVFLSNPDMVTGKRIAVVGKLNGKQLFTSWVEGPVGGYSEIEAIVRRQYPKLREVVLYRHSA